MEAVKYLEKDNEVKFKTTNYKAITEEKVTKAVRAELVKNKLVVLPIEQAHSKEGNLTTVDTKYKIIDAETGHYEVIVSSGTGVDTQDKGVGKAMTYAFKYLFLRSFAIPTGEDPDKTSNEELEENQKIQDELLDDVVSKWQILNNDEDILKARKSFNEFLISSKGKSINHLDQKSLENFNEQFSNMLKDKSKEKKGAK
ncbi:hypothetical protein ERL59_06795 [Chengkuizengella sp. YPA3-1-1]|uniref:ERF superfamily protein n=2 Tax=Chengkuizengella marina TaxID=2507566 RepID=A0A6N9Q271_9BACL|nr:hypothetical protein [Chengkuizengella marina]